MLREILKKINELWLSEGVKLSKPLYPTQVNRAFENLLGQVSKDVIEVYSTLGGMRDFGSDSTCFSFWTMERILEENKPNTELILFADFLIDSHFYGFRFENENVS